METCKLLGGRVEGKGLSGLDDVIKGNWKVIGKNHWTYKPNYRQVGLPKKTREGESWEESTWTRDQNKSPELASTNMGI